MAPKAVGDDIFDRFLNSDNCQLGVASDVIPSVFIDPTGLGVAVKLGDSTSNCSRHIRLPHFVTDDDGRRTL